MFYILLCPRWALVPLLALVSTAAIATETWVITDAQHPVYGQPDRLIELDAAQRIEDNLSRQLPSDPNQAAAIVTRRLNDGGTDLQHRIRKAYQDVTDAWSLGISTIPAVVVDRRYVVYGLTDLGAALARVEQYRKEHP